ncbi:MAG: N-acetyl sugar amidotransferase [Candidatus Omnitrophica bacterium]|nr:N-acetyl sugar amidotransferase [Candidatus Omnitrophota bacterium]
MSTALKPELNVCTRCVMDTSIPGITFDEKGVCNYCEIHDRLEKHFPQNEVGEKYCRDWVTRIKKDGQKNEYDCVVGVSGGTDSCYLLYLAKEWGLRPLAVNLDNGWNSQIAVSNIKKCTRALGIDLRTYVINWEEIRDILVSFLKASIPWADAPTDTAITSALYKIAAEENIRYVLIGADFRTEGKQPSEWTYCDGRLVKSVHKRFGKLPMKTFPNLTIMNLLYYGFIKGIKNIRPLYYLTYNKQEARKFLEDQYGWEYYGGHHYESIFTSFVLTVLLPEKFHADKRKVTYSAQIRSGFRDRQKALEDLQKPPLSAKEREEAIKYVTKKLGLSAEEFESIYNAQPKTPFDYPSYYPLIKHFGPIVRLFLKLVFPWTPTTFHEREARSDNNNE